MLLFIYYHIMCTMCTICIILYNTAIYTILAYNIIYECILGTADLQGTFPALLIQIIPGPMNTINNGRYQVCTSQVDAYTLK